MAEKAPRGPELNDTAKALLKQQPALRARVLRALRRASAMFRNDPESRRALGQAARVRRAIQEDDDG